MLKAAIVTTCKGRLSYLKQCLPSWLAQDVLPFIDFRVYVVDYGCPDGAADWCDRQREPKLNAVRAVDNTWPFNLSRARNIGLRTAIADGAEILAAVDADVQLRPWFLRRYAGAMLSNGWELCKVSAGGTAEDPCFVGTCVVTSRLFMAVRGYDESLEGYGHDDTDFYWRCERQSPGLIGSLPSDLTHLMNAEAERVAFYREKNMQASIEKNFAAIADRGREVNCGEWGRPLLLNAEN